MNYKMKAFLIFMMLANLAWIVPTWYPRSPEMSTSTTAVRLQPKETSSDSVQVRQTVIDFLTWYQAHGQGANRILLVNQPAGKPYSVNLKNGDRYLTYLKGSHLLTDGFLNEFRAYFKERNVAFQLNPQFEGPPDGFEFDLILLNQDVDKQLESLNTLQIGKVTISQDQALIGFTLIDTYEFRMAQQNGRWMIDEILNSSQE